MADPRARRGAPEAPPGDSQPVFAEPWQAQAFAMALALHETGAFGWDEWSRALGEERLRARRDGDPDLNGAYYRHWLAALERLCIEKAVLSTAELTERKEAWRRAYLDTPHGRPVELPAAGKN